jgi:hypothetical protein
MAQRKNIPVVWPEKEAGKGEGWSNLKFDQIN